MQLNDRILQIARADEGTWEWAGDENNPVVVAYYAEAGHPEVKDDSVPWCAAFVGAVLAKAGVQGTGSLLARSYESWGEKVSPEDIQPGDVIVFPRGNSSWQGHVGFVAGLAGDKVRVLGGNQGDQVNVKAYRLSDAIAIRRAKEPRTSVGQSSTIRATGAGAAGVCTAGGAAIAGLDGTAQIVVVVALAVVALALAWIARERIKKWAAGVR